MPPDLRAITLPMQMEGRMIGITIDSITTYDRETIVYMSYDKNLPFALQNTAERMILALQFRKTMAEKELMFLNLYFFNLPKSLWLDLFKGGSNKKELFQSETRIDTWWIINAIQFILRLCFISICKVGFLNCHILHISFCKRNQE